MGDVERGEKNVTLVTADKLVTGLDLTLASLLLKMEQDLDNQEGVTTERGFLPPVPPVTSTLVGRPPVLAPQALSSRTTGTPPFGLRVTSGSGAILRPETRRR